MAQKKDKNNVVLEEYRDQFVTVYGTEKNPYHATGKPFEIHPQQADLLEKKGFITRTAPEGSEDQQEEGDAQ